MKIFALETDEDNLIKSFLSTDEEVVLEVKFSAFLFVIRSIHAIVLTLLFLAVGATLSVFGLPWQWVALGLFVIWVPFVFFKWMTAFIDWKFDLLVVTTEEVVVIDQSSLFHRNIRQMNLDNIASVAAETQFWNVLPFGKLHFELKEGVGKSITLPYVPHTQQVASVISDAIVQFQRRRAVAATAIAHGAPPAQAERIAERAAPAPPFQAVPPPPSGSDKQAG